MPIEINDKVECTGCGACLNICPQNCISMVTDVSGFAYPKVNLDSCINCNLCINTCPLIGYQKKMVSNMPNVYAAWSNDSSIRFASTSGGIFSELAYTILNKGGKVVGAAYGKDNFVEHKIIEVAQDVDLIRQSKYIQSDIALIFREIKHELDSGKLILFSGAPCQVAALKKFLHKQYQNLISVDFICRGINSPKAYRYWLEELEQKFASRVIKVWFKYKKYGWKDSPLCTRVLFENGRTIIINANKNTFMRGYLDGNLYLRPSCSKCKFKGEARESDITLADFWSVHEKLDDDQGTSLVMINSEVGQMLFDGIKSRVTYHVRPFAEISKGNICFKESERLNPKSDDFFKRLESQPFSVLINEFVPVSMKKSARIFLSRCKRAVLKRLGFL